MRYGCSANPEDIQLIKALGFDYIELKGSYITSLTEYDFSSINDFIHRLEIPCYGLNAYCPATLQMIGSGANNDNTRKYAEVCAKRSFLLGAKVVGIGSPFSRMLATFTSLPTAKAQMTEFLKITTEVFASYDITVCLEALAPCYCNFINYIEEAMEYVTQVNHSHLGLVLDFYNMEHNDEADIDLSPYINHIKHVHISDDAGDPRKRYFLQPNKTLLHQKRLNQLRSLGYNKGISLEVDLPVNGSDAAASLAVLTHI